MKCGRCGGFMVPHRYTDMLDTTDGTYSDGFRCVNCGEIVDDVVRQHRVRTRASGPQATRGWSRTVAA